MKKNLIMLLLAAILVTGCAAPSAATPAAEVVEPATAEPVAAEPTAAPTEISFEPVTLTVNLTKGVQSLGPMYIAMSKGYFEQFGITIETVTLQKPNDALPLLLNGDLDILIGSVDSGVLNTIAADPEIRFVADRGYIRMPNECTYYGLVIQKSLYDSGEITKPEDLKGRKIVTSVTSPGLFVLSKYLQQGGLTVNDIEMMSIPVSAWGESLKNKEVDGIFTTETILTRLIQQSDGYVLAKAEELTDMQLSGLIFGKDLRVDNRDVGVRFLAAYLMGIREYSKGKTEENLQILQEQTGEDPQVLKDACWMQFNPDASMNFSSFDDYQNHMLSLKLIENKFTVDQVYDPSLAAEAQSLLAETGY